MLNFMLFLFVGVGITNIVVNAALLDGLRNFVIDKFPKTEYLLQCMLCSGFWVGFFLWFFIPISFTWMFLLSPVFAGAVISLASSFYDIVTDKLIVAEGRFEDND